MFLFEKKGPGFWNELQTKYQNLLSNLNSYELINAMLDHMSTRLEKSICNDDMIIQFVFRFAYSPPVAILESIAKKKPALILRIRQELRYSLPKNNH